MPFPQTKQQILNFVNDPQNISNIVTMIRAYALYSDFKSPSLKMVEKPYPDQPEHVRELFESLLELHPKYQTPYGQRYLLNKEIYMIMIELSHVLDKLAEFNDKVLERQFVTKIAENREGSVATAAELLQDLHMFTKTQTVSESQFLTTLDIALKINTFTHPDLEISHCFERFILGVDRCFAVGSADLICVLCNKKNNDTFLIVAEYDGVLKSDEKKRRREASYKSLIGDSITIGDSAIIGDQCYETKLKGLQVVSGKNYQELFDKSLRAFNEAVSHILQVPKGNKIPNEMTEYLAQESKKLRQEKPYTSSNYPVASSISDCARYNTKD